MNDLFAQYDPRNRIWRIIREDHTGGYADIAHLHPDGEFEDSIARSDAIIDWRWIDPGQELPDQ